MSRFDELSSILLAELKCQAGHNQVLGLMIREGSPLTVEEYPQRTVVGRAARRTQRARNQDHSPLERLRTPAAGHAGWLAIKFHDKIAALMPSQGNSSAEGVHHAVITQALGSPFSTNWYKHSREFLRSALEPKPFPIISVVCGWCSISRIPWAANPPTGAW